MKKLWIEDSKTYDGSQLKSLYAYLNHKLLGDSIVAWRGPCNVTLDHMLDGEDRLANAKICGSDMLHFIVEKFDVDLYAGVGFQRLLAALCLDLLRDQVKDSKIKDQLRRDGDDVFWGDKKFSISIATLSPVSTLIHFAVNCKNEGTPVPTCSLEDFGISPNQFAQSLMSQFCTEIQSIQDATRKVIPVL